MRARLAISLVLVALVLAVFAQVRGHELLNYDDRIYIVENPMLRQALGAASLRRAFSPYENNWIPLTWISLQLDRALFGPAAAGFLSTNVALHAASAVLLFLAFARMTGALGCSAFVAAIFAVHPLHVESVAWASERKDTLSGLFFALTLLAWARYAERPSAARYLAAAVGLALGLMAKPMLVTVPLVLLLLDDWPLGRLRPAPGAPLDPTRLRRAVLEKLPLLALAAGAAGLTFQVQRETGAMAGEAMAMAPRIANALDSYAVYLAKSLWPSGLAAFYPHPGSSLPGWRPVAAAALLAALTAAALRSARQHPYGLVGWLWYLGMLVPVSGLVQVGLQARADRYTYLPLIGLTLAVAWGARDLAGPAPARRRALAALGAAVVAGHAAVAFVQVGYWRDTQTLFARAVAVTDDNYLAHSALGAHLLAEDEVEAARGHFAEALRLKPRWPSAHVGLADALAAAGELDAAIARYESALALAPRHAQGRANYAKALADAGRYDEAVHQYQRALRVGGRKREGRLHALLASALADSGDLDAAIDHYERAIAAEPGYAEAHANLGLALRRAGRDAEAERAFERALALGADSPELRIGLAETALRLGRPAAAADHYREALRLDPGSLTAANNLAWLLATDPDPRVRQPPEALALAVSAASGPRASEPALLDTLAVAYAANGRYAEAVATAARAADLAEARGDPRMAAEIRARLALFQGGRPYLERPRR